MSVFTREMIKAISQDYMCNNPAQPYDEQRGPYGVNHISTNPLVDALQSLTVTKKGDCGQCILEELEDVFRQMLPEYRPTLGLGRYTNKNANSIDRRLKSMMIGVKCKLSDSCSICS